MMMSSDDDAEIVTQAVFVHLSLRQRMYISAKEICKNVCKCSKKLTKMVRMVTDDDNDPILS